MQSYYNGLVVDRWVEDLGPTFMVRGLFYVNHRLFTLDPRAINHIMSQPYLYAKPSILTRLLKQYMRDGLITAEGHRHKVQRKATQKLFSSNAMRSMATVVFEKTDQVRRSSLYQIGIDESLLILPVSSSRTFSTIYVSIQL